MRQSQMQIIRQDRGHAPFIHHNCQARSPFCLARGPYFGGKVCVSACTQLYLRLGIASGLQRWEARLGYSLAPLGSLNTGN